MSRPRQADLPAAPTVERLLGAAEEEFGRSGFAAARLEDIAQAVGIRRPSLLYHFPTKEALYAAVVRRAFAELTGALLGAMEVRGGFAARLEAMVAAYLAFLRARPRFAALLLREMLDGQGPGRALLVDELGPLLDRVEGFVAGARGVRRGLPVRGAILQVASGALVQAAALDLQRPLWGGPPEATVPALARTLLLKE